MNLSERLQERKQHKAAEAQTAEVAECERRDRQFQRLQDALAFRNKLVEKYPAVFSLTDPVPLAVGISSHIKLAFPDVPARTIGRTMHGWTRQSKYLQALIADGAVRNNLDGSVQGPVTAEQKAFAIAALGERGR